VGAGPPAGCRGFSSQPGIASQRACRAALRARTPEPSVGAGIGLPATPYRRSGTFRSDNPPLTRGDRPTAAAARTIPTVPCPSCRLSNNAAGVCAHPRQPPGVTASLMPTAPASMSLRSSAIQGGESPPERAHRTARHRRLFRANPTKWRPPPVSGGPPPRPPARCNSRQWSCLGVQDMRRASLFSSSVRYRLARVRGVGVPVSCPDPLSARRHPDNPGALRDARRQ
jgi:hypothetical protein